MVENVNPRKTGDWTADEEKRVAALYAEHGDVDTVAEITGRARRSVIGKLSGMGLYVKPEKPRTAKKDDGPTKGEIQTAIENSFGFSMDGFQAATKPALLRLQARFAELQGGDETED